MSNTRKAGRFAAWLPWRRPPTDASPFAQPAPHRPRGFGEAPVTAPAPPGQAVGDDDFPDRPPTFSRADGDGTGPDGHRRRMREKILERGTDALADYELLEMLLYFAFKKGDTKPLAKSLVQRYGSYAGVLTAPTHELLETRGLGPHSVAAIRLVQGAALRLAGAELREQPVLNNWDKLMDYLGAVLARERIEHFRTLFLDPRNRLIADEVQGRGTVNHTPVYPREVARRALELHATAVILVHNHPSGDPTPSREDVEMTHEVAQAVAAIGVVVHDHVIVGNGRWVSLKRDGYL